MELFREFLPALYLFIHLTLCVGIFRDEGHVRGVLGVAEQVVEFLEALLHLSDFLLALLHGLLGTLLTALLLLALGVGRLTTRSLTPDPSRGGEGSRQI